VRPSRQRLIALLAVLVTVIAVIAWQRGGGPTAGKPAAGAEPAAAGSKRPLGVMRRIDGKWVRIAPNDPRAGVVGPTPDGMVRVEGKVYELDKTDAVPGVEVVFSGASGEATTMTDLTGRYRLDVEPGAYRAFVRGDSVLSIGPRIDDRLPSTPQAGVAGVPDDQIATSLVLREDEHGIDLPVVRGGTVTGRVVDGSGRPVASAVVRALGSVVRPVLGTDLAETDGDGRFRLDLPVGTYALEASHDRFAGVDQVNRDPLVQVEAGRDATIEIVMVLGCVVEGRVLTASGTPSGDGALERKFGASDLEFGPTGKIDADGTFRWTTTTEGEVTLRAWPWKSTHSGARTFACRDGARFSDVVFQIPNTGPDMSGTVVMADGTPARFAFLDIFALGPDGINQQERADADGNWGVFAMPPGEYRISVFVPDGGVVTQTITSPASNIRLVLGGTGSIAGKVAGIDDGSFTMELGGCDDGVGREDRVRRQVVVPIRGGTYRVDTVPACAQTIIARAPTRERTESVTVAAGGVTDLDLDLGPRRKKRVTGIVSDDRGPVEGALVTAAYGDDQARAETDSRGWYEIETYAGEGIYAYRGSAQAFATVGEADVPEERVDLRLGNEEEFDDDEIDVQ
jgi:hypothetical protein